MLSPTLFSLDQDEPLSLHKLLQLASIGRRETDEWIETLLRLSGASKALEDAVQMLEPQMKGLEEHLYPKMIELERWQRQMKRVRETHTPEQQKQLKDNGYTFLNPDQLSLVYGSSRKSL